MENPRRVVMLTGALLLCLAVLVIEATQMDVERENFRKMRVIKDVPVGDVEIPGAKK